MNPGTFIKKLQACIQYKCHCRFELLWFQMNIPCSVKCNQLLHGKWRANFTNKWLMLLNWMCSTSHSNLLSKQRLKESHFDDVCNKKGLLWSLVEKQNWLSDSDLIWEKKIHFYSQCHRQLLMQKWLHSCTVQAFCSQGRGSHCHVQLTPPIQSQPPCDTTEQHSTYYWQCPGPQPCGVGTRPPSADQTEDNPVGRGWGWSIPQRAH